MKGVQNNKPRITGTGMFCPNVLNLPRMGNLAELAGHLNTRKAPLLSEMALEWVKDYLILPTRIAREMRFVKGVRSV